MIDLRPGDVFCSTDTNNNLRTIAIRRAERYWSVDNNAFYTHSGLIIDEYGTTFEALERVTTQNLYKSYQNSQVLIGRHIEMDTGIFFENFPEFYAEHINDGYPYWRLILFLLHPPLAKKIHFSGMPVCSELVKQFGVACGLCNYWSGTTPDYIADMIKNWRFWEIIYEGAL